MRKALLSLVVAVGVITLATASPATIYLVNLDNADVKTTLAHGVGG